MTNSFRVSILFKQASTSVNTRDLISLWKRAWCKLKHKRKHIFFPVLVLALVPHRISTMETFLLGQLKHSFQLPFPFCVGACFHLAVSLVFVPVLALLLGGYFPKQRLVIKRSENQVLAEWLLHSCLLGCDGPSSPYSCHFCWCCYPLSVW